MDVEIQLTSAFSFLRGASLPEDLVERAAALGYGAVALLDRDGLYGAPRFYRAARAHQIHPIVGAVVTVVAAGVPGALALYVRSRAGYQNLCQLITAAKGRVSKQAARDHGAPLALDELAARRAGLAAVLLPGEAPLRDIPRGTSPASAWARAVAGVFGADDAYVAQSRHYDRAQLRTMARALHLGTSLGLRPLATNDVLHATPAARALADVFACARAHTTLDAAGTRVAANAERYLKPPAAMRDLFRDEPAWLANARALAESCAFSLSDLGYRFPTYPLDPGETEQGFLEALVWRVAPARFRPVDARTRAQLARELAMIARLGLAGYFLVVWDLVQFCARAGIMVQGRGSAANSAVCFALSITAVDPVKMELLFERFLSEERGEWPDIDLDLPSGDQREKVIQYVYARYGARGAAMTANVITYRSRSAVRECGKALGYPLELLARLGKGLHWGTASREDLTAHFAEAGLDARDARVATWIDTAHRLQNLPRHLGQHSGGMVIAQGQLDAVCPLEPASMPGRVVVQWDKDDCADLGILKVDLLGLGMMAVLEDLVPMVRAHDGAPFDDLAHIPADDPATYAMLQAADTVGVFQVESRAQMATLPRMKPTKFYDLVVEVALIRPGPIVGGMVNPYLRRRMGREAPAYPHPDLEPILKRTLGIPLFQEQLMRVAMTAAGFTGGEAEELRRAMGSKRSVERMAVLEQKLRAGMTANGYTADAQQQVVAGITSFALYGFPESHSASFALLAYASAYLKCHYPASFTCALLNHWPMGFYHPSTVVKDAQRHGVRVLPVDVTRSRWDCARVPDPGDKPGSRGAVRLGLRYVAGVREDVGRAIEHAARARPFASLDDFAHRTGAHRTELAMLAELGALAALPRADGAAGYTRRGALWQALRVAQKPAGGLFDRADTPDEPSPLADMTLAERIGADYHASGITVGPHPLALRRTALAARGVLRTADLARRGDGAYVAVAGAVITRQRPPTAKGYFFLTIEDETGLANAIVAPDVFDEQRAVMVTAPVVVLHGVVQHQDGVLSLRVHHAEALGGPAGDVALPEAHDFR